MRRIITYLFLLLSIQTIDAQSIHAFFVSMPDSIVPYLNASNRDILMQFTETGKDTLSIVDNQVGEKSWVSFKSDDKIVFHPSSSLTMEIARCVSDADTVFCVVRTYKAPETESVVALYDSRWNVLSNVDISHCAATFQPDSISSERYTELRNMIEIPMVSATFAHDDSQTLLVSYSLPLLPEDEKEKVKHVIMQTKLKWDGETFK